MKDKRKRRKSFGFRLYCIITIVVYFCSHSAQLVSVRYFSICSRSGFKLFVPGFRGGGSSHAAHCQAVTAAQSQGPGGVGSVGMWR